MADFTETTDMILALMPVIIMIMVLSWVFGAFSGLKMK